MADIGELLERGAIHTVTWRDPQPADCPHGLGTDSCYINRRCRCPACTDAHRRYEASRVARSA